MVFENWNGVSKITLNGDNENRKSNGTGNGRVRLLPRYMRTVECDIKYTLKKKKINGKKIWHRHLSVYWI